LAAILNKPIIIIIITALGLHVTRCGMDKKHAVNKISVVVDMREFKVVGSRSQAVTGFSSSR